MTSSDVNGTVVAIQGEPISNASPSNGNVLTWDNADGYWVPRSGLQNMVVFTSSGTWTAPNNVYGVWLIGYGGGGGGATASTATNMSAGGGGGSVQITNYIAVVPGITYTITVGNGGGAAVDGQDTLFDTLATFAGGGRAGNEGFIFAGGNVSGITSSSLVFSPGFGGTASLPATRSLQGYAGGSGGSDVGTSHGGAGGGGGPGGAGGNGGNGNNSGAGANGSNAGVNTGAGGGGAGCGSTAGGTGGSGGSGKLTILW